MANCRTIKYIKSKLCSGDLDHLISIQTRTLGETLPGESSPSETFVTILQPWAGIITPELQGSGVRRFNGVTLETNTTHIFYVFYDPTISALEVNNNFILYDGERYSIVSATDMNKQKETIMIQAALTGVTLEESSEA